MIVILQALILAYLAISRRVPNGHDGFQYLELQYIFFNGAAAAGRIPQWLPYMTQGTVATWWYAIQAAPLQAALLPLAPFFKRLPFLALFYAGVFIDFAFLIVGTWLLAKRFMRSKTALFLVTFTLTGSTLWYNQVWHNFHFFSMIPLILYLLHRLLDSGETPYLFLAGSLFILQMFGNLPYASPPASFAIALYFLIHVGANFGDYRRTLSRMMRDGRNYVVLCLLAGMAAGAYVLLSFGTMEIATRPELGRNIDRTVTFANFISYAAGLGPLRWAELVLGFSPGLDYSLFVGYLALPLIGLSLWGMNRRNLQFFLSAILLALLCEGNRPLAFLFYYLWPFAKFYRHLTLISPFVRFFLCFLIGFGVDTLLRLDSMDDRRRLLARSFLAAASAGLLLVGAFLVWLQGAPAAMERFTDLYRSLKGAPVIGIKDFTMDVFRVFSVFSDPSLLREHLLRAAIFAFASGLLLLGPGLFLNSKRRALWILLACAVQTADIGSYHILEALDRTFPLRSAAAAFSFEKMPYIPRRSADIFASPTPRFQSFLTGYPFMGSNDWQHYMFFFADSSSSAFRTDHWLKPLDRLISAFGVQELNYMRPGGPSRHFVYWPFHFPDYKPAASKMGGVSEDKLQFFSDARLASDGKAAAGIIGLGRYQGDTLVLEPLDSGAFATAPMPPRLPSLDLENKNERVMLPYQVTGFNCNQLAVSIDNSAGKARWMFYSDVWHPGWRAAVNGRPAPIYRADLAYKAILLPSGKDIVEFTFWSPLLYALQLSLSALAWFWLAIISALLRSIVSSVGPGMARRSRGSQES